MKSKEDLNKLNKKFDSENLKRIQDQTKKEIAAKDKQAQFEKDLLNVRLQAASNFLSAGITLAKQGSAEQRALQSAQAIVSTYTAANQALSAPPGPPWTFPLVASVVAGGLANVSKINSQKFANGGFVGGASNVGDQVPILANSGEFVANRSQQQNILNAVASGNVGGGQGGLSDEAVMALANRPVVVEIDGREIARATRDASTDGFKVA